MPTIAPHVCDLRGGRLSAAAYASNFSDAHPPLSHLQAQLEAERCYYCYDAPCTSACPTEIDVPAFIHRLAQGNERGAARAILQANPLGGLCARVCPTELLCEQACVRNVQQDKPVEIAALQRYATDSYFARPGAPLWSRAAPTGRRVAVVGAGPAGLACAHGLALQGHAVVLLEARAKLGGLNEYGLARYKTTDDFAQREIDWLLSIGGIEPRCQQQLGRDFTLDGLLQEYDAVFLGLGLAAVQALDIGEPELAGLRDAVDFIAELRQAQDLSTLAVGRRVLVIGGGMTAVDAAVQARKLGAQEVTMVYRRGPQHMSASAHEQQWAQTQGVKIVHWAAPLELLSEDGVLQGMRFVGTRLQDGKLLHSGEPFTLEADMVLKAIGQRYLPEPAGAALVLKNGRIATDDSGRTSVARVWAGGDCRAGGLDLTVDAVAHGKAAALSMHGFLSAAGQGAAS
jgi:dihydropyrimidine dehydrogenase (NAD+) subunit PreT